MGRLHRSQIASMWRWLRLSAAAALRESHSRLKFDSEFVMVSAINQNAVFVTVVIENDLLAPFVLPLMTPMLSPFTAAVGHELIGEDGGTCGHGLNDPGVQSSFATQGTPSPELLPSEISSVPVTPFSTGQ